MEILILLLVILAAVLAVVVLLGVSARVNLLALAVLALAFAHLVAIL